MRLFLTTIPIFISAIVIAQTRSDSVVVFSGYILTEDSIPVENAYLINYRDTKIVATDSSGYFKTYARMGDSLMINHLTLQPRVIHAKEGKARSNKFYVNYRNYQLQTIATRSFSLDYCYFEKNIKKIYADLERLGLRNPHMNRSGTGNPYNPDRTSMGVGIDLAELFRLFKKK